MFKHIAQKNSNLNIFSVAQIETLCFVKSNGSPTMKDVSEYLNISPPSATSIIEPLVKKHELKRITAPRDRRIVQVEITPKGEKKLEESIKNMTTQLEKVLDVLSEKEIKQFSLILEKMSHVEYEK